MLAGQRSHLYDPFPYPTANDHRREMVASIQSRVESWIRDQRSRLASGGGLSWPRMRWPWQPGREERQRIQEEFDRRRRQLQDLCRAVKTESVSDLQDILCSMVLSECVYKVVSLLDRSILRFCWVAVIGWVRLELCPVCFLSLTGLWNLRLLVEKLRL